MADLLLNQVRKSFGKFDVLHGIDLKIADGEFVVLVGPSGCGKSTLLRIIAGLEDLTSGDLVIGGREASNTPPQKRNIAMVFQSYALFPHLNVRDNIAYGQKLRREPPEEIARKVAWAAEILNLTDYLDRFPRQLSGGQRQRVAMGRAIVRAPALFLYDEPLSNLDAQLRVQMRTEIKALHKKVGTTSIYVTHDQIEAMTLADRIVVMNGGRVEQVGTPLELFDRPQTVFVAKFIGSPAMNMFEMIHANGRLVPVGGGPVGGGPAGGGPGLPVPPGFRLPEAAAVTLGIRPEHMRPVEGSEGLDFRADIAEQTGSDSYLYGRVGAVAATVMFRERTQVSDNARLTILPPPGALHLFDSATGNRIPETQA